MATAFQCTLAFAFVAQIVLQSALAWKEDTLPGWMGESYHRGRKHHAISGRRMMRGTDNKIDPSKVIQLSWKPRAFLYPGFLTEEECDHIINLAKEKVQRSTVVGESVGQGVLSEIRTSSGMFLKKAQDEIVKGVEEKIAAWTFLPKENSESIQVLRYNFNQKYEAHTDYFHDPQNIQQGGHRVATVLMYLSDVEKGGETVFPQSEEKPQKDDSWSECGKRGVATKPKKGDALLFFSLHPDASPDVTSMHAGCPVLAGVKWSATKWIHVEPFDPPARDPSKCVDYNDSCDMWAKAGECEKNKPYMIGDRDDVGSCRLACSACDLNDS